MRIRWQSDDFDLLAQRALWRPRDGSLFVADVHLGKAAAFRAAGIPVPDGAAAADLARLSELVTGLSARRLVILGDLIHAPAARSPETLAALANWRSALPRLHLLLVRGNHDRNAGDPPEELGFEVVDEPWRDDAGGGSSVALVFRHQPPALHDADGAASLCGHLHPVVVVRGPAGGGVRARCFHVSPGCITLPAFGSFTGGHPVAARAGDRVFAIGGGEVAEVPIVLTAGTARPARARR